MFNAEKNNNKFILVPTPDKVPKTVLAAHQDVPGAMCIQAIEA